MSSKKAIIQEVTEAFSKDKDRKYWDQFFVDSKEDAEQVRFAVSKLGCTCEISKPMSAGASMQRTDTGKSDMVPCGSMFQLTISNVGELGSS